MKKEKQQYSMLRQIIMYCDTVKKIKRLTAVLKCICYHHKTESRAEKREMIQQLTEKRQQMFTVTNMLRLKVNASTIQVMIHVKVVRKLQNYRQKSDRADRNELKSKTIL